MIFQSRIQIRPWFNLPCLPLYHLLCLALTQAYWKLVNNLIAHQTKDNTVIYRQIPRSLCTNHLWAPNTSIRITCCWAILPQP
ncbi:hypothetical protein C8R41DRAFT_846544 [Lentinula lateritia]|uniref:Uncharacterized protein n=1 Tax=Lentinula lateritia TaxID=40482 RepID=A0ABQ8V5Y0_9AGAR|nr:hypothetical protein C8R41DRAFT_846544 [Lentinula lateritia]